ncbi:MAG: MarC family protein [Proteobacteria bacterium]|nr:MarC family protein [Pseudomonadota bacterium]MBU1611288.1 MarC family protein [Pseudomonadota bacterium]
MTTLSLFISVLIKLFFLLTPFFVLSVFMAMTRELEAGEQRRIAVRTTLAVMALSLLLYFFGPLIFKTLGITLDAFRIGAGALLFLSAVSLVRGRSAPEAEGEGDFSVVPLAMPITVGPATIGTLMVLGGELTGTDKLVGCGALLTAAACVGVLLFFARIVERFLGPMTLTILMKLTGLILSALSAQLVFTGIRNFLA